LFSLFNLLLVLVVYISHYLNTKIFYILTKRYVSQVLDWSCGKEGQSKPIVNALKDTGKGLGGGN